NESVDLASHADVVRQIDARLDREPDSGNQLALLARLQVVDVGPRSVQIARIDRVAGAMKEVVAVASLFDHLSGCVVDLAAAHRLAGADSLTQQRDRGVPRVPHGEPDLHVAIRWSAQ